MLITNKTKLSDIPKNKIGLYRKYLKGKTKDTAFSKFKLLKDTDVKSYVRRATNLSRKVKYVCFNKKTLKFIIRPYINGERHYVGTYTDFDVAVKDLNKYLVTYFYATN